MEGFSWGHLINPEFYIKLGGLYLVLFIVFAETGLFVGFFLPGDSLLFLSGIYSQEMSREIFNFNSDFLNVFFTASLISIAAVIGNEFGYFFGKRSGTYLYTKKDGLFYKKKYLFQAKEFYEKHGGKAVIIARFFPIIRTFAPIIAGIIKMDKFKFLVFNIVGSILWSFSLVFAGHYLYSLFLEEFNFDLKKHIEIIVIAIVLMTTVPVALKFIKKKKNNQEKDY